MRDIVKETKDGHIVRVGPGHYEVYKSGATAAHRVGIYHFSNKPDYAYQRAVERLENLPRRFSV